VHTNLSWISALKRRHENHRFAFCFRALIPGRGLNNKTFFTFVKNGFLILPLAFKLPLEVQSKIKKPPQLR